MVLHVWVLAAVSWRHVTAEMSSDFIASEASSISGKWLSLAHLHSFLLLDFPLFVSPHFPPSFYSLKYAVLVAPASCWQFLLWYLDSPLFASSSGGKGEKTSRYLWVFRWGFPGCPHGLQENGWQHFFFSCFCLLQLSALVYLSMCRWIDRLIDPYICVVLCLVVSNSVTPGTIAHRLLCPWGFSRQEYWSGLPCPPPDDLPNPGIEPGSPALQADSLPCEFQFTWVCNGGTGRAWRITLPLSKRWINGITVNPKSWIKSLKALPQSSKVFWTVFLIKPCRLVYLYVKYSEEYPHMNVSLITCTVM